MTRIEKLKKDLEDWEDGKATEIEWSEETKYLIAQNEELQRQVEATYKQCVGRDYMHLPLNEAVQAAREKDWEQVADLTRQLADANADFKAVEILHDAAVIKNALLRQQLADAKALLNKYGKHEEGCTADHSQDCKDHGIYHGKCRCQCSHLFNREKLQFEFICICGFGKVNR